MSQVVTQRPLRLSTLAAVIAAMCSADAAAGTISGRVQDSSGVRALQGAQLRLAELGRTAAAGSDGTYRFTDVAPGRYTLIATYVGAASVTREVEVTGDETVRADVDLGSALEEDVLVIGQRANLASSLSRQRASDTIESRSLISP